MCKIKISHLVRAKIRHIWSQDNSSYNFYEANCSKISNEIDDCLARIFTLTNNHFYITNIGYWKTRSITCITIRNSKTDISLANSHQIICSISTHPNFPSSTPKKTLFKWFILMFFFLLLFQLLNNYCFIFRRNSRIYFYRISYLYLRLEW